MRTWDYIQCRTPQAEKNQPRGLSKLNIKKNPIRKLAKDMHRQVTEEDTQNKHTERCTAPLGKYKLKLHWDTTIHLSWLGATRSRWGCRGSSSLTRWQPLTLETSLAVSNKTKPATAVQPSNSMPGHLSRRSEDFCTYTKQRHVNVYGSFICNIQKLETI